jgi:hypothetical protein
MTSLHDAAAPLDMRHHDDYQRRAAYPERRQMLGQSAADLALLEFGTWETRQCGWKAARDRRRTG